MPYTDPSSGKRVTVVGGIAQNLTRKQRANQQVAQRARARRARGVAPVYEAAWRQLTAEYDLVAGLRQSEFADTAPCGLAEGEIEAVLAIHKRRLVRSRRDVPRPTPPPRLDLDVEALSLPNLSLLH